MLNPSFWGKATLTKPAEWLLSTFLPSDSQSLNSNVVPLTHSGLFLAVRGSSLDTESRKFSTVSPTYKSVIETHCYGVRRGVFLIFSSEFLCPFHREYALRQRKLWEDTHRVWWLGRVWRKIRPVLCEKQQCRQGASNSPRVALLRNDSLKMTFT